MIEGIIYLQIYLSRVAWDVVCFNRKKGGLNMINSEHALIALLCKWVVYACHSNFKTLLRHRLASF